MDSVNLSSFLPLKLIAVFFVRVFDLHIIQFFLICIKNFSVNLLIALNVLKFLSWDLLRSMIIHANQHSNQ